MTATTTERKRYVRSAYKRDRKVRILSEFGGYKGKIGIIARAGEEFVYVRIRTGKQPQDWDEIAYLPEDVRLI